MLIYVVVASVALTAGLVVLLLGVSLGTEGRAVQRRLAEIGVGADDVGVLAPMAAADVTAATNPRPLTLEAAAELYRLAIAGELACR